MKDRRHISVCGWLLIGLFGLGVLALAVGGYRLYRHETESVRSERRNDLKAIAELKVGQIAAWRKERLGDARMNSTGIIRTSVVQWLKIPDAAVSKAAITESMESLRKSYGYENIIFTSPDGRVLLSLDSRLRVLDATAKRLVAQTIIVRGEVFGDLFRCPTCKQVHLDVAAPILDPDGRPVAVLILRSNPEQFLYPFVQSWPTPSPSAETLLVRRDGDNALLLNQLRHRPNPALSLRIPLRAAMFRPLGRPWGKPESSRGGITETWKYWPKFSLCQTRPG